MMYMAGQYSGPVPGALDETILHEVNSLLQLRIISLAETKRRPDPQYDFPRSSHK